MVSGSLVHQKKLEFLYIFVVILLVSGQPVRPCEERGIGKMVMENKDRSILIKPIAVSGGAITNDTYN